MWSPVFHLSVVVLNVFTLWYDHRYIDVSVGNGISLQDLPLHGRFLFLTIWGLTLQTMYFTVAFVNDIFGTRAPTRRSSAPLIRNIKDTMFSLAFPVAIFVFTAFWGIYIVDKELILPEHIRKVFPSWVNHVMHTLIAPFALLELLTSYINYPSRKLGISMGISFTLAYVMLLFGVYAKSGIWVYPFLGVLNWTQRLVFVVGGTAIGIGFYLFGEKLNSLCTRKVNKEKNENS